MSRDGCLWAIIIAGCMLAAAAFAGVVVVFG
jgi:hypothetical protein